MAGAITLATTPRRHPAETVGEEEQEEVVEVEVAVVVAADRRGHQAVAAVEDKHGHQEVAAAAAAEAGTQPTDTPISKSPCP